MVLPFSFYTGNDVVAIARGLLGKVLVSRAGGITCKVRITETEAYEGIIDMASHAHGGRFTERTRIMYEAGGTAYVYLCYGIHHLFNIVTSVKGTPHAVLVRAGEPLEGLEEMLLRRNKVKAGKTLTSGPGALSQAMGITTALSGSSLLGKGPIWLEDDGTVIPAENIISTTRIGVDYAGEHAQWPYRFYIKDSVWVSKK